MAATGKVVARFIDFLIRNEVLRAEELVIVGFSLGAHVAGFAGKFVELGRINSIIALDPAAPLFSLSNPSSRLDYTDAH